MEQTLQRLKNGCYKGEAGSIFRLLSVTREYNKKKKPVYYLQEIREGKARYVSGLFQTKYENIFSFDIVDKIGVKVFYELETMDKGELLKIKKAKREK
jgi:hypothetical protein